MSESNNNRVYLPLIISFSVIAGILIGYFYYTSTGGNPMANSSEKIPSILRYLNKYYVDSISIPKLTEQAIPQILKNLDPHTVYMPAEDAERESEPLEGGFSGIGVQFNMDHDTVIVINTIPNGPSAKAGILPGDRIVKVNGETVAGMKWKSDSVIKRLKGPRGTKVNVSILRPSLKSLLAFTIIRDNIPLHSVDVAYMPTPDIGYIKINQFSRTTNDEFENAVMKLKQQKMKKLVLDLRGNGGGYMDAAIRLADQFLSEGKMVVYTVGRHGKKEDVAKATSIGLCEDIEMAVLIDEFSASASEILAGAIQDNDRGMVIGRRSFGKGLVQKPITLDDGSQIRITIARYYTPTGRCIQKPYNKGEGDYERDLLKRYENGEFSSKDSIHQSDSLKYATPKGKIVYGGGGIMPDIFVPIEKDAGSIFYQKVRTNGLTYTFAFEYTDINRQSLMHLKNSKAISEYLERQNVLKEFIDYAAKKGINAEKDLSPHAKHLLNIQLKAYISRNILDNEGFYPLIKEIDETLKEAIKELSK